MSGVGKQVTDARGWGRGLRVAAAVGERAHTLEPPLGRTRHTSFKVQHLHDKVNVWRMPCILLCMWQF